jgi:hypothetical protein
MNNNKSKKKRLLTVMGHPGLLAERPSHQPGLTFSASPSTRMGEPRRRGLNQVGTRKEATGGRPPAAAAFSARPPEPSRRTPSSARGRDAPPRLERWASAAVTGVSAAAISVSTKYRYLFYLFFFAIFPDTSSIPYRRRIAVSDTYRDTGTAVQGSIG